MPSAKRRPFCSGLDILIKDIEHHNFNFNKRSVIVIDEQNKHTFRPLPYKSVIFIWAHFCPKKICIDWNCV